MPPDRVSASLDCFVNRISHGGEIGAKTFKRHDKARGAMTYLYESVRLAVFTLLRGPVAIWTLET